MTQTLTASNDQLYSGTGDYTTVSLDAHTPCGCQKATDMAQNSDVSETGWVMVVPDGFTADFLAEIEIAPGDLHGHGREKEPHITVMGFINAYIGEGEKNHEAIKQAIANMRPFSVEIVGLDLFERMDYDVLMFRVRSPELDELHAQLRTAVSHEWPHDEYNPHLTVAYLKPGTGQAYLDKTNLDGRMFTVKQIVYRAPDFTQAGHDELVFKRHDFVYTLDESETTAVEPIAITGNATDFPTKGDDQKISLRNSQYPQFDYAYAVALKDEYPDIWQRGGNIRGNDAFALWGRARDGAETTAVLDWIKEREAWAARHLDNFQLAGVVAQIKWGVIGSRGQSYMKELVNEAKRKLDGNQSAPLVSPKRTDQHTLINLHMTVNAGRSQRVTKHGRDYLVVPYVGVVEGVMNGKLILMEEVKRAGLLWDDSAVVVDHPRVNDTYISSKSPDVPKIGRVYNSYVEGDKLMGDLWVDVDAAKATREGQSALNRLARGETMEVSWGWWQAPEPTSGEFKGNAYDAISRNLIPDHLAILLNVPGACSVADGCGTYRVNQAEQGQAPSVDLLTNGCTCATHGGQPHTEVHMSDELENRDGSDVEEVTQEVITEATEPAPDTAVVEAEPVAEAEPISANASVDFSALQRELQELKQTVSSLQANAKEKERQERSARIARLAANATCPFDANELSDFTDAQLQRFEAKYRTADFSGRGGMYQEVNRQKVEPLVAPAVLLAPVKSGKEA